MELLLVQFVCILFLSSLPADADAESPYKFFRVDNTSATDPEAGIRELISVVRLSKGFVSVIFPKETLQLQSTCFGAFFTGGDVVKTVSEPYYTAHAVKCEVLNGKENWLCLRWKDAVPASSASAQFKSCDEDDPSGECNRFANESQEIAGMSASVGESDTAPLFNLGGRYAFLAPIYLVSPPKGSILFNRSLTLSKTADDQLVTSLIRLFNWFSMKADDVHKNGKNQTSEFGDRAGYRTITFIFHYQRIELDLKPDSDLPRVIASFSSYSKCYLHAVNKNRNNSAFIHTCGTNQTDTRVYSMDELFHMSSCNPKTKYFEAATEMPDRKSVRYFVNHTTGLYGMVSGCPVEQPIYTAFNELHGGGEMFENYTKGAGGAVVHVPSYKFTYWFKNYFIVPQYDQEAGKHMFRDYYKKTCCLPTEPANFREKVDSAYLKPSTSSKGDVLVFFKDNYFMEYDFDAVIKDPSAWQRFNINHRADVWPEAFVPNYRPYKNYPHSIELPVDVKDYTEPLVNKALGQLQCGDKQSDSKCSTGADLYTYLTETLYKNYVGANNMVSKPIFITTYPTNKAYLDTQKDIHVLQYHLGNLTSNSMARMVGAIFLNDALNIPFEDFQCDCSQKYSPHSGGDVPNINCKYQAKGGKCAGKAQTNHSCIMHDFSTYGLNPFTKDTEFAFCNTTMKYLGWLKP